MDVKTMAGKLPGLFPSLVLGAAAAAAGKALPAVGPAILALSAGLAARALLGTLRPGPFPRSLAPGLAFAAKPLLQVAIVLLGARTSLGRVAEVGLESLAVMLASLGAAFLAAYLIGRALRVEPRLAVLIGTGTAICGGSAIAAAAPAIGAEESDTAYAFSVIFAFNLVAVFVFPVLGGFLGLSDRGFGLWAGTAINDSSSVVAAGYAWSAAAGDYAVVVKLARTAMIVPVTLVLSALAARGAFDRPGGASPADAASGGATPGGAARALPARAGRGKAAGLPWFIPAFLGASLARSLGLIGPELGEALAKGGVFLIGVALAAIGLSTDFRRVAAAGWRPLALGLATWASVALSSLAVQALLGHG